MLLVVVLVISNIPYSMLVLVVSDAIAVNNAAGCGADDKQHAIKHGGSCC